jgi:hypothetical protein
VFKVSLSGKETVLHTFTGSKDGEYPFGSLLAVNGVIYGTTAYGGTPDFGTIFTIAP